ncbi:MAG: hypothetical protein FJ318_00430 [SAR202 cluster bacterium]|nr:hypothetical protein [SAR202 cluster bacterium]
MQQPSSAHQRSVSPRHPRLLVVAPTRRELGGLRPGAAGASHVALVRVGHEAGPALRQLLASSRPGLVVSAGYAGGLNPRAGTGDIAVCSAVMDGHGAAVALDAGLVETTMRALSTRPGGYERGTLLTVESPLLSAREKWEARARFDADVVDMEAHALAEACAAAGVPMLALRAVLDEAHHDLPEFVAAIVADGGGNEWRHVGRTLARDPLAARRLPALAWRSRVASAALRRALRVVLPALEGALT